MIIKRHGTFPTKKRENELHNKTVLQHQYKYVEDTEVNTSFQFSDQNSLNLTFK